MTKQQISSRSGQTLADQPVSTKKAALLAELHAALERLANGNTRVVKQPYRICQKTVCEEAGRDRSSIKTTPEFSELRVLIATQNELQSQRKKESQRTKNKIKRLEEQVEQLKKKLSISEEALNASVEMIYELNLSIVSTDEKFQELIGLLENVRSSSTTVDKALRLAGIDAYLRSARTIDD